MITKPLFRNAFKIASFVFVFLWTCITVNAQCPTLSPTPPASPICDASGFDFTNLNAFVTDNGGGISWYPTLTGGIAYSPNELVIGGTTYYADNASGNCGSRVSVLANFRVVKSGKNLDKIYCSNNNATVQTYINDVLQSSIPVGGLVKIFYDFNLTNQANPTDVIPLGASYLYVVFVDNTGCESQIEIGQIGVFIAPGDPTPANPQAFCSVSNPVVGNLNPGTAATNYKWYANVDAFGKPIQPALMPFVPLVNGRTYYVQISDVFCVSNAIAVTVNIDTPVNPGTPANLEYCNDNLPASAFSLYNLLGGPKVTTGSWSGPLVTSGGHLGNVNISTLTTAGNYVFTYTVPSLGVCPDGVTTVTIRVNQAFSSGTASATNPATFCVVDLPAAFDLSTLLDNEDPNGQWTQGLTSSGTIVTSPIDLSGLSPNTYNFTYTQNVSPNPCPEQNTTVQVVVLQNPNAGIADNKTFCENDLVANSPFNLFNALDGSQDNNLGTWRDASNATISNTLDLTSLNVAGSPYSYNYTIDNGSCSDTEIITITVEPAPESGTAISTFPEFCVGLAPASYNLFDLLTGEDQTGIWYSGLDNTGAVVSNPVDLSGLTPGDYNFTFDVDAIGSCDDVLVTVTVTINPLPNTGTPTAAIFCENDLAANSPLDLFGQLTGQDAGGSWTDDNTSGSLTGSNVNLNSLTIGSYNFSYTITDVNGCTNSSTIVITVEDAPESGTENAPIEFCEGLAPASYNLFDLLTGEDQTGTWYSGLDNTGAVVSNPVDLSGLTPGDYNFTFDVDAIGSCDDVLVTVTVTINPLPNTGIPTPAILCENDLAANSPLDLFGQLTGQDTGGSWTDDNTSGALTGSNVNLNSLTIGSYNFSYTITDVNGCTNSSTVVVTVQDAPESGTANTPIEFCVAAITSGQTYNLFDLLTGEDQTGVWNDDDASGALSGNLVTLDGLATGTYNFTFDVNAIGTCDDVLVTVSIIINDMLAPSATPIQEFCDTATISDLAPTGSTIQWYADATGGTALLGTTSLFNGEDYFATQTDAVTGCESSVRTLVTATIYISPKSGNVIPITECNTNNAIDLFTALDGTQDAGGTWQDTDGTGALSGNIFDATGLAAGDYHFRYLVTASSPCIDAFTDITVTLEPPLNPGGNASLDVCSNNGTTDLFTLLIGSPDTGGTWSPAMASGTGVFDPLVDAPGTYTYTLTNACGTVSSDVDVIVTLAPNAGSDNTAAICVIDGQTDLFPFLGTSAQSGGTWSPLLASGTGMFDPDVDTAQVYTYTVTAVSPCPPTSSAQITVTVSDSPQIVVIEPNPSFCLVDIPTVADLAASIQPTGTVSWYTDATLSTPLTSATALVNGEDYFATQTTASGCESSLSVQINVTINDAPTPTLKDSSEEYCINDDPTINNLTLNINEYNSNTNNIVWYDANVNGSVVGDSEILTNLTTYYAALVDATTGCESSVRLAVTPDLTSCGVLRLPDGFSPNGDGINDTYEIDNLAIIYPKFEMEIYNRYGNIVYKGNASTPRFNGISNQARTVLKGDLPVGMYYYIFIFNNGENKPVQGHLYLSR